MTFKMEATDIEPIKMTVKKLNALIEYNPPVKLLMLVVIAALIIFIASVCMTLIYSKKSATHQNENRKVPFFIASFASFFILMFASAPFITIIPGAKSVAHYESAQFTPKEVKPLTSSGDPRDGVIITLDDNAEKIIDFRSDAPFPSLYRAQALDKHMEIKPDHTYKLTTPKVIISPSDALIKDQKDVSNAYIIEVK